MLHHPEISPYIFTIGGIGPTWYGLMYVIGFLLGYRLAIYRIKNMPSWTREQVDDLLTYAIVGVILGGRIGYVLFYGFAEFKEDFFYLFKITEGGMSFHGGLIGVLLACTLYCRKHQKKFLEVGDFVAPLFPIGLFFGRIGNFINGELWGRPTDVWWGMVFPRVDSLPRHPSMLYEAGLEGIFLFVMLYFYAKTNPKLGRVSGLFLIGYGVSRVIVEFFREPDAQLGFLAFHWLTMGQLLSIPMLLFGLYLLTRKVK